MQSQSSTKLNTGKCRVITFTSKHYEIQYISDIININSTRSNGTRDLGITFVNRLSFTRHVASVLSNATKMYGFLVSFSNPAAII